MLDETNTMRMRETMSKAEITSSLTIAAIFISGAVGAPGCPGAASRARGSAAD
jgi:hypothetical protein